MTRLLGLFFFALIISAQYIPPGGSSGGSPTGAAGGSLAGTYPNPSLATQAQDLLFTDATYDIGKSGATRPRDIFLSRNLNVGNILTIGTAVTINGTTGAIESIGSGLSTFTTSSLGAGGNSLSTKHTASAGIAGLQFLDSSGIELGVCGAGNTGAGVYASRVGCWSDHKDIVFIQGGLRMIMSRRVADGGTGDITFYDNGSLVAFALRGATGNAEFVADVNALTVTSPTYSSASNMTMKAASGRTLILGGDNTAQLTFPADHLTMTLSGNVRQSGALDATNGQLKLQATNNDQSALTLWPQASGANAASRVWMLASNADNFGNLEIYRSTTNSGAPSTKVLEIINDSSAIFAGTIQSTAGYKSADGTAGATTTCTIAGLISITVKNGLITGCS